MISGYRSKFAGQLVGSLIIAGGFTVSAGAHPHIIANVKMEVIASEDGSARAIRAAWRYDSFYSSFVRRMADLDKDGQLSEAELRAFARQQIHALGEFGYYTHVRTDSKSESFSQASDYGLVEENDGQLTLTFTLTFDRPVAARRYNIEVFDPQFFAYFTTPKERGVTFLSSTGSCELTVQTPAPIDLKNTGTIPAAFWSALRGNQSDARQFVNRIDILCQ